MKRTWEVGPYEGDDGRLYPPSDEELARELIGASFALNRFGGSLVVVPKRLRYEKDDGGSDFQTVGWVLKFETNVPAVDAPKAERPEPEAEAIPEPPAEPEVVPEPEPALAG